MKVFIYLYYTVNITHNDDSDSGRRINGGNRGGTLSLTKLPQSPRYWTMGPYLCPYLSAPFLGPFLRILTSVCCALEYPNDSQSRSYDNWFGREWVVDALQLSVKEKIND